MFTQKRRKDAFRLLIPKEFIPEEINKKYSNILKSAKSFYTRPIDFLNETIQKIDVLGFTGGTIQQQQSSRGVPLRDPRRVQQNDMMHMAADVNYRSPDSILKLVDRTLNIEFRHTLGNINYFLLLESFIYQYSRDTKYIPDLDYNFNIEILNENGATYSKIILYHPLIDSLDMLTFDNTSTIAQTESFKCVFKYNNFDYQFIQTDPVTAQIDLDEYTDEIEQSWPYYDGEIVGSTDNTKKRVPKFMTDSPTASAPGGIPYLPGVEAPKDGQIFFDDEGGVLKDIVHHTWTTTPGTLTNDNTFNDNGKPKEKDPGSFIDELATDKMEYSGGLAENLKFINYPYDKDYENRKRQLSTFEITTSRDKSETKVDENDEKTNEYPTKSEWPIWDAMEFDKFRHKK